MLPPCTLLQFPISLKIQVQGITKDLPRLTDLASTPLVLPLATLPIVNLVPIMLASSVYLEDSKLVPPQSLPMCGSL